MRVIEGGELSGAAVKVDETGAERRQETKAVINCNETKWTISFIIHVADCWNIDGNEGKIDYIR